MVMIRIEDERFKGVIGVNAVLRTLPRGVNFDADAEAIEVLNNAGIRYVPAAAAISTLTAGQVLIDGTGFYIRGAINGRVVTLPVDMPFTPTDDQSALLALGAPFGSKLVYPDPTWRNVATRLRLPTDVYTPNKQIQSRTGVFIRDNVTSLKLVLPNFWTPNFEFSGTKYTDTALGAISTWTAAIEYPAGTFTQVRLNGQAAMSAAADKSYFTTDACNVTIPKGAMAWIRLFCQNAAGAYHTADPGGTSVQQTAAFGDACEQAASGIVDKTMGGTMGNNTPWGSVTPLAVLAYSSVESPALTGDSKCYGERDTANANGDAGEIARSIGAALPYINMGVRGDAAINFAAGTNFATNAPLRSQLIRDFYTSVISQYGFNDIHTYGSSPAATLAALQKIWALRTKVFQSTITVKTDAANTTPVGTAANGLSLNTSIRAVPSPLKAVFDVASVVDNGSLWLSTGDQFDGLHETPTGYNRIQTSGVVDPAKVVA